MRAPRVHRLALPILALACASFATSPRADVVDSGAGGFTVRTTVEIAAPSPDVYRALVADVGRWWNSEHTWFGDASRLSIEAVPGGCFCERGANGAGVSHLTVVFADPGRLLRLKGALGPLQEIAATGTMDWSLAEKDGEVGTTTLQLTYRVSGYFDGGLREWAGPVDRVLREQVLRLKSWIESGDPDRVESDAQEDRSREPRSPRSQS
jgi:uncharacterized protein YndB with AHSA1/START domain